MIYLDTSVVVPFYWPEPLSETVEQLFRTETELRLSQLVEVEFFSAISRRVRIREISQERAREGLFRHHGVKCSHRLRFGRKPCAPTFWRTRIRRRTANHLRVREKYLTVGAYGIPLVST